VGQRKRLPVVVDASAMGFATVFCSAGRRGLEIEIAPADLVRAAGATVADINRPPLIPLKRKLSLAGCPVLGR
jgi:Cys-tRNA(Pro)/Cys-tRNA(Cys) deacylase